MSVQSNIPVMFDSENPLMNPKALPFGAPCLDQVRNEHFLPAIRWAVAKARADIEEIKKNPASPTFANTIEALEDAGEDLSRITPVFSCFCSSKSDDELREIEQVAETELSNYHSDIALDEVLFKRIQAAYESCDRHSLSPEQKMLFDETYKGFVRSGALLEGTAKTRMKEINEQLAALTTKYSVNVLKATESYKKLIADEAELDGVPPRAKALYKRLAEDAGHKNQFLVTLEPYPADIFTHASNRKLREEIYRASATRCYRDEYDNLGLVVDLVRLRGEKASLLGYRTYADFVLDDRMAKNVRTVSDMLETNLSTYKPAAEKELKKIQELASEMDQIDEIKPWDLAYYARILKEKMFNLELETLRPYFNLENVLFGVQKHIEKLFNIEMKPETTGKYPVYHEDVKVYEIVDQQSRQIVGIFYADYYARPGEKRGGAWMSTFRDRSKHGTNISIPLVINNCNFPKPTPEQPTFLSIGDVETVFHEFGHALHALLAQGTYASLSGPNVKWDFVELPSQVQERWVSEKEVLDTFAHHHKTGQPLPEQIIRTIQSMQNFDAGMLGLGQTFYGLLDMAYYSIDPNKIQDPETLEKSIAARATLIKREAGLMSTTFQHIFAGGYSAGYYSYKWAEVLDADVFSAFKSKGLYDPDLSSKLRSLYAKGGTEPPMDIFIGMMGRKPDPSALFKLSGLTNS